MGQPLDPLIIQARLKECVPALQAIDGAAAFAAVTSMSGFRPGSAFVVLVREADPRAADGNSAQRRDSGRQQAETTFGVVVAVRNYRDAAGGSAQQDALPLIGGVRDALMGWTPDLKMMRPIWWLQGEVLDYDKSTLLWCDVFATTHFIGGLDLEHR